MTPSRILKGCHPRGDCLLWSGGLGGGGYPYVWSPVDGRSMNARKIIWRTGDPMPVPATHRIVMTCRHRLCLSREHMKVMTRQQCSAFAVEGGSYHTVRKLVANATNARKNSKIGSMERAQELREAVRSKQMTVQQAAVAYGVHERVVQKMLKGERWVTQAAPNSSVWSMVA